MSADIEKNRFGEHLRAIRASSGMSISDISVKVDVSKGYISRIERGKDKPSCEMIDKLAEAIGTDPEQLHILAGSIPSDVRKILYEHPEESHTYLREAFSAYETTNKSIIKPEEAPPDNVDPIPAKQIKDLFKIQNTDCFGWMNKQSENSFQAIVTDPPYGLKEYTSEEKTKLRNGHGGVWRIPPHFDGCKRSPLPRFTVLTEAEKRTLKDFFSEWASLAFRVLVPGGHLFIATNPLVSHFVYVPLLEAGFEKRGEIIRLVQTLRGGDRPKNAHEEFSDVAVMPRSCWEPWGLFRKPCDGRVQDNLRKWKTGGLRRISDESPFCDVIKSSPTRGIEREIAPHPSLKPQAFMREIVRAALPLGKGIILDPFMGAGSTIAAACYVGYKSVGIELDEEFFNIAKAAIPKLVQIQVTKGGKRKNGISAQQRLFEL